VRSGSAENGYTALRHCLQQRRNLLACASANSKDLEKTAYVFVDGDRHEAMVVRDSAGFQHGGIVWLTNGKFASRVTDYLC
jgi:hypothetical protein